jgi:hypothetical protein
MTIGCLIFDVGGGNRDAARLFFRRIVNGIKGTHQNLRIMLCQDFGNGCRQGGFAVVNVSDCPDVDVRFASIKLLFAHNLVFLTPLNL